VWDIIYYCFLKTVRVLTRKPIHLFSAHVIEKAVLEVNGKVQQDHPETGNKEGGVPLLRDSNEKSGDDSDTHGDESEN
jgi:hypothetical protein